MAEADWADRARTLTQAGYARYDEKTATLLGKTAQFLLGSHHGDLRRVRTRAERRPSQERLLLKACKGLGDVGVDIFFREMQAIWPELYPFADKKALQAADRLGLGNDAARLAELTDDTGGFVRLIAALVRCELAHDHDAVTAQTTVLTEEG